MPKRKTQQELNEQASKHFDDFIEAYAKLELPKADKDFFMVLYDASYPRSAEDMGEQAYIFTTKRHAIACAYALSHGNMSRRVVSCRTVHKEHFRR